VNLAQCLPHLSLPLMDGVHPFRLNDLAHLLREMATDFSDPSQVDLPLRQVLVSTHSPAFISQPEVIGSLLFAFTVTRIEPRKYTYQVTRMAPVLTVDVQAKIEQDTERDKTVEFYTLDQIKKYLDSENFDTASEQITKARTTLSEG